MRENRPWTDEKIAMLTKGVAEGLSASVVASRIGGVTRSAVIGKAHRLGLQFNSRPPCSTTHGPASAPCWKARKASKPRTNHKDFVFGAPYPRSAPTAQPASSTPSPDGAELPVAKDIVVLEADPPEAERVAFEDLKAEQCRWPIDGKFCGRPQSPRGAGVYCHSHGARAYVKENPKRKWRKDDPRRGRMAAQSRANFAARNGATA